MSPRFLVEAYDVVWVHDARIPYVPVQNHIQGSLKCGWCNINRKGHSIEPLRARVTYDRFIVLLFLFHRYLPVTKVGINGFNHCGLAQTIDALAHPREGVSYVEGHRVKHTLKLSEAE